MFSTRTLPRAHSDTWTRVFYSSPLKMYGNGLKIEPINIMCFVLKGIYIFTDQIYIKEVCFNVYIYFFKVWFISMELANLLLAGFFILVHDIVLN